jgi:hypothetical protein
VAGTSDPEAGESGAPRRSIVETWTEVVADAGGLVRAEAALARAETAANLKGLGIQTGKLVVGGMLLLLALVFLTTGLIAALALVTGWLAALLIVAAVCAGCGVLLVNWGRTGMSNQQILPERSLRRMSRDLERLAEQGAPLPGAAPEAR